ncbi:MAG: hypothetical protein KAQ71_13260, partial [Desulfobulbaceae bacterium]|nr:hypothetical protein [Desulfobulbaceae bacterium]
MDKIAEHIYGRLVFLLIVLLCFFFGTISTVHAANPVAVADSYTVDEGSTTNLFIAENDTDSDGDIDLTSIIIVSDPTNGSILPPNSDGTVDYTHDGSETTGDSFTYTIKDGTTNDGTVDTSNTVTVSLTITPINDSPTGTVTIS